MTNQKKATTVSLFAFVLACLTPILSGYAAAQAPVPDSPAIEAKAHALVAKLTLEQKIELLGGIDSMYTHAMPSIDLPRFKMSDASVGVRTWGPTTAYAGGVALAATWDTQFARSLGEALGNDARARSVNFLLGPGVNIARSSIGGRNFEYLSEDPFLNSTLVVPFIQGVQSKGVIATVKHYALNNQEFNRHNASSCSSSASSSSTSSSSSSAHSSPPTSMMNSTPSFSINSCAVLPIKRSVKSSIVPVYIIFPPGAKPLTSAVSTSPTPPKNATACSHYPVIRK